MQEQDYEYAGFWIRLGASLIDTLLLMLITFPPLIAIYGWSYFDNDQFVTGTADFLISFVLPLIGTLLFWLYKQATPGKMTVSAKDTLQKSGKS